MKKTTDKQFTYGRIHTLREAAPPGKFMNHAMLTLIEEGPGILIDSGYDERSDLALSWLAERTGGKLEVLLLTHHHSDHLGGAEAICAATGAPAYFHPVEARYGAERAPDLRPLLFEEGEILRFGSVSLEAILTPGHAPAHIAFWWKEQRILFGGDNVLMPVTTWVGPPLGNLGDYIASLHRMRDLEPEVIYPGHGPPVEDPAARIDAILKHRERREKQVLEALADGFGTPELIGQQIYAGLEGRQLAMGTTVIVAHLEKLVAEGRVTPEGERYLLAG